jgi:hypothetical protein
MNDRRVREGFVPPTDEAPPSEPPLDLVETDLPAEIDPYQQVEELRDKIGELQQQLRAALAATKTKEIWPITVKLLHKMGRNNKNEPIAELTFREPTGGDINRYGNPVYIDQNGAVMIDERKMNMMISSLSGVSPPFLNALDPRDWNSCAYRLRGFFVPEGAAW